ncbi:hypothetical protein K1W54_04510 [Micromonospora sp. CPCC 205371]|nr:hypothetical protein [Micromonospora sp. CPCC 205371]
MSNEGTHRMPKVRIGLRRRDWAFMAVAVLLAVGLGYGIYTIGQWRAQVDALAVALAAEQRQSEKAGLTPAAPAPSEILNDPQVVEGAPGRDGRDGKDVTPQMVRAAVEAYFRANPPDPSPAAIAAAVVNYIRDHPIPAGPKGDRGEPGDDGQDVTAEMVAAAVRDYLVEHPPPAGEKGDKGDPGQDGRDVTPEMVAEQVRLYIEGHGLPLCPDGTRAETHRLVTAEPGTVNAVICVRQVEGAGR